MATNNFLEFARGATPNVISDSAYSALAARDSGFASGVAQSQQLNKVWRQGSLMAAVLGQIIANNGVNATDSDTVATLVTNLLNAINAQGVTAPQFDNDGSLATTAFVQRALGNVSTVTTLGIGATTTLTAAHMGDLLVVQGGTINLPAASSVAAGSVVEIFTTAAATLNCNGTDKLQFDGNAGNLLASISVEGAEQLRLVCNGSNTWVVFGSSQWKYSPKFGASLGVNGWQKLPSGLIIQWGQSSVGVGSGSSATISFPIAFPNNVFVVDPFFQQVGATVNGTSYLLVKGLALANFTVQRGNASNLDTFSGIAWVAIGF